MVGSTAELLAYGKFQSSDPKTAGKLAIFLLEYEESVHEMLIFLDEVLLDL